MDFASQVGSKNYKNPSKINVKRPSDVELIFDRFFVPTLTSRTFKSMVFPKEQRDFFKTALFELHIDFGSMLVPTCFHFSAKNPPKSHKKSIPKGIENLIDFRPHFSLIFAPSCDPSWAHVGHFFATRRPQDPPKKHQK